MKLQSALYMIPVNISEAPLADVLPSANLEIVRGIRHFIVENIRTARRFLKRCDSSIDIDAITFYELNGHTDSLQVSSYLDPLRQGEPVGMMSEAGCPGVADPGALPAKIAQEEGLRVIPLVGPSSILMSLMASGLNGQCFAFRGYLPVDGMEREKKIRELENQSRRDDMTQIFIETPYRNVSMFESLVKSLKDDTMLCVASAVTDPENERIITRRVGDWKKNRIQIEKHPTIFLFYSGDSAVFGPKSIKASHGKKKNFV